MSILPSCSHAHPACSLFWNDHDDPNTAEVEVSWQQGAPVEREQGAARPCSGF